MLAAVAVASWATIAHGGYKSIAMTGVPAAEMKVATDAVAGFVPTSARSDGDCNLLFECGDRYAIAGKANGVGVVVFVSSDQDGSRVDRIDTQVDVKTVPAPVLQAMAKQTRFRPAALFLSRRGDEQIYLFVGAQGSVPTNIEIRPNGSVVRSAKAKKN
jgi:hypothetical protein